MNRSGTISPSDKAVFANSGYGACQGFAKPGLLIIDVNHAFCGDKPEPILNRSRSGAIPAARTPRGAAHIRALIDKAREKAADHLHDRRAARRPVDSGSWAWKNNRSDEDVSSKTSMSNLDGNEIVTPIAPAPQDIVVLKQKPSGFFGSNLASYLTLLGCDSLIVTGTTTSGCVRASVLDAFSLNYRITLAEEGCFDRSQASHAINLCDMNAKYADVVKTAEVLAFFDTLRKGMFELPKGVAAAEPRPVRRAANY